MAISTTFLIALIGAVGLVHCQVDRERPVRIAEGCSGKVMDVFFLLDSSSSIYINEYMSQHRLTRDIISRFDVSEESTRVGLLTFSDDLERPVLNLNRYNNKNDLLNSISVQNLPYRKGVTNTDQAIRYVRQLNEFRNDITKVMVVMTDGGSRSPAATAREAELARAAGFYMFTVGIGQYLEEREWRAIASDPDDSFVYNITSPRLLEEVKFSLPPRACNLPPIIIGGSCDVSRPSEVYFVGGRSTSSQAVDVIEYFTRRTRDRRDLLRASYYVDGCNQVSNLILVDNEPFICDRFNAETGEPVAPSSTAQMFRQAVSALRNSRNVGPDTNKVIVLFADDEILSQERFELANAARNAENFEGVTVVLADMGIRTYRDFALRMVNNRNNIVNFSSGSVSTQTDAQARIIRATCDAVNGIGGRTPTFEGGSN